MFSGLISFFKLRTVKCPDGTIRLVYRDIDAAFPLTIHGWEANIAASLKNELAGNANLDLKYKSKIEGLLIYLDEFNNSLIAEFRAAYIVFQGNPCSKFDYFARSTEKISESKSQTKLMKMKIAALIELARVPGQVDHGKFMQIFGEIVGRISPSKTVELTVESLHEAEKTAQEFIGPAK